MMPVAKETVEQVLKEAEAMVEGRVGTRLEESVPVQMSKEEYERGLRLQVEKDRLKYEVDKALRRGAQWLEISEELLEDICAGPIPQAGYIIWYNMRLCPYGTSEALAKKEKMTIHEILFVKDGFSYVAKPKA